jgi:hypothetical protein
MEAVLKGASTAELSRQKRFCYRTVRRMLAAFSQHAPEEHRENVAGVRGLLQELAFDDLLHWRAESRNPRHRRAATTDNSMEAADLEYLRTASHAYHEACRMLIKLYGLASSGTMHIFPPAQPSTLRLAPDSWQGGRSETCGSCAALLDAPLRPDCSRAGASMGCGLDGWGIRGKTWIATPKSTNLLTAATSIVFALLMAGTTAVASVRVETVPEDGLQPEVAVGPDGIVHLVYLRGDSGSADVRYTWRRAGQPWAEAQTVNSRPGSAVAIGSIRGAQVAVGKAGRVHIIWNGAAAAETAGSSLWYSRGSLASGFEAQRDLLEGMVALDGGASVASDAKGGVVVVWHANERGEEPEENRRVVALRASRDDGTEFGRAEILNGEARGVCACCSLRATTDAEGRVHVLFRNTRSGGHRPMSLLSPAPSGWQVKEVEDWEVTTCPMSSSALFTDGTRLLGAWETEARIRVAWLSSPGLAPRTLGAVSGAKHPVIAGNQNGRLLVAWTEGTGWNRGGSVAWQELDDTLEPVGPPGKAPDLAVWGRVAAFAGPDGTFVVLR